MKKSISLATIFLLSLVGNVWASDPVGIYALIDRVVLEPSEGQPERIQIWGAFSVSVKNFGDQYTEPVRGYLYYTLDGQKDAAARAEWRDMQQVAGSGQIIAFGSRYKESGTIRRGAGPAGKADEKRAEVQPDPYPMGFGVNRVRADQNSDHVKQLRKIPAAASPADGMVAEAGAVKLIAGNIADTTSTAKYYFEIESTDGQREASEPLAQGQTRTQWTPKMQIKTGQKYTWRVWVDDGKGKGPVATAMFTGK